MSYIDIIFEGVPDRPGRFRRAESDSGHSTTYGSWHHRPDGYWALRIPLEAQKPVHGLLSPWRIEEQLSNNQEKIMALLDDIKTALARNTDDEARLIAVLETTLASNVTLANQLAAVLAVGGGAVDPTALQAIKDQLDADNTTMQAEISKVTAPPPVVTDPPPVVTSSSSNVSSGGTVDNGGTFSDFGTVDSGGTVLGTGTVDSGGDNAGTVSGTVTS